MIIHGTANDSKVSLHLLHLQLHLLFCSHLRWLYSLRRAIRHKLCWDQQIWADLWLSHYLFKVIGWKLGSVVAVLLAWHYWLSKQSGLKNVNNNKNRKPRIMHKQFRWCHHFCSNLEPEFTWRTLQPSRLASPLPQAALGATGSFCRTHSDWTKLQM